MDCDGILGAGDRTICFCGHVTTNRAGSLFPGASTLGGWWFSTLGSGSLVSSFCVVDVVGLGLRASSIRASTSTLSCSADLLLRFPCNACIKSLHALAIVSAGVMVGCVMYLCLKKTVSEIRLCLVSFTNMLWHL